MLRAELLSRAARLRQVLLGLLGTRRCDLQTLRKHFGARSEARDGATERGQPAGQLRDVERLRRDELRQWRIRVGRKELCLLERHRRASDELLGPAMEASGLFRDAMARLYSPARLLELQPLDACLCIHNLGAQLVCVSGACLGSALLFAQHLDAGVVVAQLPVLLLQLCDIRFQRAYMTSLPCSRASDGARRSHRFEQLTMQLLGQARVLLLGL